MKKPPSRKFGSTRFLQSSASGHHFSRTQYPSGSNIMHPFGGTGGISVTQDMLAILQQPGYISIKKGGQRLRYLYQQNSSTFTSTLLSRFGFHCYFAQIDEIKKAVETGTSPDLNGTETPFKFGYATLVIAGAQRATTQNSEALDHAPVMKYLLARGMLPDVEDIAGLTALHHASMSHAQVELSRILLEAGAAVNHQNRYGEVCLLHAFQTNEIGSIDLLMEFGADLNIEDADNVKPITYFLRCGPQVTATVRKWMRKRTGEEAPMDEKRCEGCRKRDPDIKLMLCSKCLVARYCSTQCQRSHWRTHKTICQPFSAANTVTLKPSYTSGDHRIIPSANFVRHCMGIPTPPTPESHHRGAHTPKSLSSESKSIVIKVQVPFNFEDDKRPLSEECLNMGDLLIYTKKRDFVCVIRRKENVVAYDRISRVVKIQGVGGAKAYFAAELKTKDELVVKVSEVLAEQPF